VTNLLYTAVHTCFKVRTDKPLRAFLYQYQSDKYSVSDKSVADFICYWLVFMCSLQIVLTGLHQRHLTHGGLLFYWLVWDQWRINSVSIDVNSLTC